MRHCGNDRRETAHAREDIDRLPAAVMGRLNIVSIGPPQNRLPFGFVHTVML